MTMRISGLTNSGLDIDALVKASLKPYELKIQTQKQQKQVLEWQQEQYQSIMKKSNDFYNKYLDPISSTSLIADSAYNQSKFVSSQESAVSITGSSTANISNYKVDVTQIATKAYGTINNADITSGNKIKINGTEFTLKGKNSTEIANNLNADIGIYNSNQNLATDKINVTARYSNLANDGFGGMVIENKDVGATNLKIEFSQKAGTSTGLGVSTTGSFSTSISGSKLIAGNKVKINDTEYTLNGATPADIVSNLNNDIAAQNVSATYDSDKGIMILKSTNPAGPTNPNDDPANKFTASTIINGSETKLNVDIDGKYSTAPFAITKAEASTKGFAINGQNFRVEYKADDTIDLDKLNTQLSKSYMEASVDGTGKLVVTSKYTGTAAKFTASTVSFTEIASGAEDGKVTVKDGENLSAKISDGTNDYTITKGSLLNGTKIIGNQVTVDGATFNFKSMPTGTVTVTGSKDVTALKDKIVNFVKDYNELIGEVNGKLWESYDSDYQPLTDEQKEAMSENQIKQWETKAKSGLLRKDDDISRLAENMKSVMSTLMDSTGIDLEKIGIKPVQDYKDKNGTFEINEEKLTTALQENFDDVRDLFIKGNTADTLTGAGILPKFKELMKDNFTKYDSIFNKKASTSGVYALTNEMTKQILDKKKLIDEMNTDLKSREDGFYKKFSALETAMAKAESQQSSMSNMFSS